MVTQTRLQASDVYAPPLVRDWGRKALIGGGVLALASILGFILNPVQAMHAYLLAFMLCLGLTLGSLAMLMLWHLSGGEWGQMIRRIFEAASATLPMMMVAFIPIIIGLKLNYEWAGDLSRADDHFRMLASQYLRPSLFLLRAGLYFVGWWLLARYLIKWSSQLDSPPARTLAPLFRKISGGGLLFYCWALTFASIDWVMSLSAPWPSSIFALIFIVAQAQIALSLAVVVAVLLLDYRPFSHVIHSRHFLDYGKLMLALTMLWGWFSFSQWLIIWAGNLPDETIWFMHRIHGGWEYMAFALILGRFCIPFALLLSRGLKQNPITLFWVAVWIAFWCFVDLYWYIEPTWSKEAFYIHWTYIVVPLAMLGLWLGYFCWNLARRPLVAFYDPHLQLIMEAEDE